jgi:isopentenyl diphosphate isomerase/L-lactate dehydrogenase-like FMN-dependent dehydrogenase
MACRRRSIATQRQNVHREWDEKVRNPFSGVRLRLSSQSEPISVEDYRRLARRKLPSMVWAYVEGGAEDGATIRGNRDAYARWTLRPRVLTGLKRNSLAVNVCGTQLSLPVFLAPTGLTALTHWSGEPAAARAAENARTRAIISTSASYSPEEVARGTRENHWFQLYPWGDPNRSRELAKSFIKRAYNAGFECLFLTVDVPVVGNRETERRHGMGLPPTLTPLRVIDAARRPDWSYHFVRHGRIAPALMVDDGARRTAVDDAKRQLSLLRPEIDWDDFAWMREEWRDRPLFVKGVLHPADAAHAVDLGADGVLVSNHGGRQLDGALSSLDALPAIAEAVGGRVPVLLDGGVRRGSDVIKALCLGATAVGIGRSYLYGLAAHGEAGVGHVLEILREEISRTLTLLGCESVDDLSRDYLIPSRCPSDG